MPKVSAKTESMAIQKLERDIENLLKRYSTYDRQSDVRSVKKDSFIQMFGDLGVFKEISKGRGKEA